MTRHQDDDWMTGCADGEWDDSMCRWLEEDDWRVGSFGWLLSLWWWWWWLVIVTGDYDWWWMRCRFWVWSSIWRNNVVWHESLGFFQHQPAFRALIASSTCTAAHHSRLCYRINSHFQVSERKIMEQKMVLCWLLISVARSLASNTLTFVIICRTGSPEVYSLFNNSIARLFNYHLNLNICYGYQ